MQASIAGTFPESPASMPPIPAPRHVLLPPTLGKNRPVPAASLPLQPPSADTPARISGAALEYSSFLIPTSGWASRTMRHLTSCLLLLTWLTCHASEVQLSLFERATSTTTVFLLDTSNLKLTPTSAVQGSELPQITTYASVGGKLVSGNVKLTDADEVLFQCRLDNIDLVVVRDEYNSFGGPLRILVAFAGHPIQVSKILVLAISNGQVVSEREITRKDSSYHWVAKVFH